MKTFKYLLFVLCFSLLSGLTLKAQVPTTGDCLGAIPVCQSIYYFGSSVHGPGHYTDLHYWGPPSTNNCPGSCIAAGEQNTTWFIFTIESSGLLNFLINPNNSSDDYDWSVYSLTTNGCSGIYFGGMQVSCNYCMNLGPTGANGGSALNCQGPTACTPFNASVPVSVGETYVLMVDNFSSSNFGYTLDFSSSTASIFDNIPPQMVSLGPVVCGATTLNLTFSENVICSSVNGGDFTITAPGGGPYTVTSVTGPNCSVGGNMEDTYTLNISPPMSTAGTYSLNLIGPVSDACGNIAPNSSLNFYIAGPPVTVTPDSSSYCNPGSVVLTASGATSYTWSPPGGLSSTGGPVVTANPTTTTNYTITGNTSGCTANPMATVIVLPGPVITVTANPPGNVCSATIDTLVASSNTPGTIFVWNPGGPGDTLITTVNNTTTYTVSATSPIGCTSSLAYTVNVTPSPNVTVSPTNPVICSTISATLTAGGATTYQWVPPIGLSVDTGQVVVATPSSTTSYTVIGTQNGCTNYAVATVTVNPLPTAIVTGGGNICNDGSTVTISIALTGTPPWNLTYSNGITQTTVNGIMSSPYTFTTSAAGIYTVNAVSDMYCPGSPMGAAVVNVFPLPVVTLSALSPVCLNTPTFQLYGGSPAGGTYSGPGVAGNNFNALVAGTGIHNIIYTYTDANQCSNSDTNTILVYVLPVVTLPPLANTCVNIPAFPLTGGTPAGGTYSGPGVNSGNFDPSVAGIGIHNIVYSYTDTIGCTNTDTSTINVQALPVVQFAPLPDVCLNTPAFTLTGGTPLGGTYSGTGVTANNFDASVAGVGTSVITYTYTDSLTACSNSAIQSQWVNPLPVVTQLPFPDVCVSTPDYLLSGGNPAGGTYTGPGIINNVFDPDTVGVGTFQIAYSYTDPTTNCTNTVITPINVLLNIPISVNPDTSFICQGQSVTLMAQGATSFTWAPSTGLSSTVGSAVISHPPTTITYSVTGTDANGCSGKTNATVNIYPVVIVNFVAIPPDGCKPLDVDFHFTPSSQVQDSTWHWDFGDIISPDDTSNQEDPFHTFIQEGNYIVTLTIKSINGCTHSGTLPVNVYAKPTAGFYWVPEVATSANPLYNFVDASVGANYWYWNFGDPATGTDDESNLADPTHIYSDTGSYHVLLIVEANHGCSDTISKNVRIYPETIIYVPNAFTPDGNLLNDTWGPVMVGVSPDNYQLVLYNRWGQKVFSSNKLGEEWDGKINGTKAPGGVYVWVIHYDDPFGKEYKMRGHVTLVK